MLIAVQYPSLFAQQVFELCNARPILGNPDTIKEVCHFIEKALAYYSPGQMLQIEETILNLPAVDDEQLNDILYERYVKTPHWSDSF